MKKLCVEDLYEISQRIRKGILFREGAIRARITIHMGTCGIAAGATEVMNAVINEIEKRNIDDVLITSSGCAGFCSREPMITVELKGETPVKYIDLTPDKMIRIFSMHVLNRKIVKEYALAKGYEKLY